MHSFRGLATSSQATLAAVAPGISEALIATAMGLFAAIPAVLAYNRFAAKADALLNRYESFVDEFSGYCNARVTLRSEVTVSEISTSGRRNKCRALYRCDVGIAGYFYGDSTTAYAGCRGGFTEG